MFTVSLVNAGLYQITGGSGTITDSAGTFSVSVAGLLANLGGVQGLCGNVVDASAFCNTMRGVNSTGANYTFDDLLYTGASQGTGQPFDANGIGFVSGASSFVLTTDQYIGHGGNALYCGPGSVYCEYLTTTLSVTAVATPEPGFYGVLAIGLAGLCFAVAQRG